MADVPGSPASGGAPRAFATTHWTLLRDAADSASPARREALEALCRNYWYPLYAYVRRSGNGADDAADLTQGFFEHLLGSGVLGKADPGRGRFRSYLVTLMANYLHKTHRDANRIKRGGGMQRVAIDAEDAETLYERDLTDEVSPERLFDRNWTRALMREVSTRLREEYEAEGQAERFEALRFCLEDAEAVPYAEVAVRIGVSVSGVKAAAHRLRSRFRGLFRERVAETLEDMRDVDDEIRHLMEALA